MCKGSPYRSQITKRNYKGIRIKNRLDNYSLDKELSRTWRRILLEHRGKGGGSPFAALHTSKSLSREERLELENLKLRIEKERLKSYLKVTMRTI